MSGAGDDRTPGQRVLYRVCRQIVYWAFTLVYRARMDGVRRLPPGGVLLVANHQSHLDPPLVGLCADRPLEYLARAGLFKSRLFAWLITGLGARPIDETGMDAGSGLRTALERLHGGQALLVFPEGSRTPDGAMHSFKRGAILLVRRAGVPVVPVAIEGTFDAWPRWRPFPRLLGQRVRVRFGAPLDPEALLRDGPEGAVRHLETQIDTMRLELRAQLRRASAGRFPAPGPGDRLRSA